MLPQNPVKVMYVCTLIYGVKPSGQQTQVTLVKLAEQFKKQGECLDGAAVLEKDTYVDDIITSTDSMQESIAIAQDIETILARGSMGVKAHSARLSQMRKFLLMVFMSALPAIFGAQ